MIILVWWLVRRPRNIMPRRNDSYRHGAASGIGEAEPGRRTPHTRGNTARTYCCAVRWVVTDKDSTEEEEVLFLSPILEDR